MSLLPNTSTTLHLLIGLYQNPNDRWFSRGVRNWRDRRLERCCVRSVVGALITPTVLLRFYPSLAETTISSKVLGRFGIAFAFAILALACVQHRKIRGYNITIGRIRFVLGNIPAKSSRFCF